MQNYKSTYLVKIKMDQRMTNEEIVKRYAELRTKRRKLIENFRFERTSIHELNWINRELERLRAMMKDET